MNEPLLKPGDTLSAIWLPATDTSPFGCSGAALHPPPGLYRLKAESITINRLPGVGDYYLVAVIVWDRRVEEGRGDTIIPLHMAEGFSV